jgi:hypothetical protein
VFFQEQIIRGLPIWLIRDYLLELGGKVSSENAITGHGWRIFLTQMEDYQIGSLKVGQVQMQLESDSNMCEHFYAELCKKMIRAGG